MELQFSEIQDPTQWTSTGIKTLKVGDVFTEGWLDNFRGLMATLNDTRRSNAALRAALAIAIKESDAWMMQACGCRPSDLMEDTLKEIRALLLEGNSE